MTTQTQKLYEAAKAVSRLRFISHPFVVLRNAISFFEQSIQEEPDNGKTKTEIWHKWDSKPDLSYNDAAYGAMIEYADQQTASKDKEISELKSTLSELIQVKDWKDKHGKDEHYLKAMPIAWNNVRKLIEK